MNEEMQQFLEETKEAPKYCDVCGKRISADAVLEQSRIAGIKSYYCEECKEAHAEPYCLLVNIGVIARYEKESDIPKYVMDILQDTLKYLGKSMNEYLIDVGKSQPNKFNGGKKK